MSIGYDEMAAGKGVLRTHWRSLIGTMASLPQGVMAERAARARALFAEADEFLSIYGHDEQRPSWSFDLLPLIIPEQEWAAIEAGLTQRARLLDLILRDLYGPQRLIADGTVPPGLVFNNPELLRPARHLLPEDRPHLHVYAADLVRLADGRWRVFADRTQTPGGIGYALRNRSIMARTFPEAFRAAPVRRLRPFIDLWKATLQGLGQGDADPRIVLLTPGPYNHAYFEHVHLAREMGITLVQGSDLTVRSDGVYLKTLDGLLPVHVIYRRVDGGYCDPLELKADSALGVAGLLGALRAGHAAMVNLPGTALVETPAFAPFLPQLSRRLLDQELAMASVRTWWCGQAVGRAAFDAAPADFVLRPTFGTDPEPHTVADMSQRDRAALRAKVEADPEGWVALERVQHSTVPTLGPDGMEPRPLLLRVTLIRHGEHWAVLPGGAARTVGGDALHRGSLRHGGVAKDVWVLTAEDEYAFIPAPARSGTAFTRPPGIVQSRSADDLFWLGRQVERIDIGARQLRAAINRLSGGTLGPRDMVELHQLARALHTAGWLSATDAAFPVDGRGFADAVLAATAGSAMRQRVDATRQIAFGVRDRLSADMWRSLNHLNTAVLGNLETADGDMDRLLAGLDDLIRTLAAFSGLAAENMTRGAAWRFLDIGRRIERGIGIASAIEAVLTGTPAQSVVGLRLALELCDSVITYQTRYPAEPRAAPVIDLVVTDGANPRALVYQLDRIVEHIAVVTGEGAAEQVAASAVRDAVAAFPIASIEGDDDRVELEPVIDMLDAAAGGLMELSDLLTRTFFSHVAATPDRAAARQKVAVR